MRHVWADWVPRVADYWHSFSAPYRQRITDLVDQHTPHGGTVMDFGCGVGVQSFLIRQRRPDILIYAFDCNPQAQNLTRVLCGVDDRLIVDDTPVIVERIPAVDTFFSIYTCSYLVPEEVGRVLTAMRQQSKVMILAEPTSLEDKVGAYAGMPTTSYAYPYGFWFDRWGDTVSTELIQASDMLNAITVAVKGVSSPEEADIALLKDMEAR
jgi:hypothetical protein